MDESTLRMLAENDRAEAQLIDWAPVTIHLLARVSGDREFNHRTTEENLLESVRRIGLGKEVEARMKIFSIELQKWAMAALALVVAARADENGETVDEYILRRIEEKTDGNQDGE